MNLQEIDKKIIEIARSINFYSYITPLNREEERDKFFKELKNNRLYNPVFKYKDRDFSGKMRALRSARSVLDESDSIQMIFAKKLDFIITQLELLGCGDPEFKSIAIKLHGSPDEECLRASKEILFDIKSEEYVFPEETVPSDEMVSILKKELNAEGIDWKCVLSSKIVPKITISGRDRTIYVNSHIDYTLAEVERLKVHEIRVHVYRGANGESQPYKIFAEGLAGYDETEEGLAIVAEDITGVLKADTRQMKLYAGRALCADYCLKGSFYETFSKLRELFPDYLAYRLTERGKRGMRDTSRPGGITKDFHYISGGLKVSKYSEAGGDLSVLYTGKIGLDDVDDVKRLIADGVLKTPKYLPEFVNSYGPRG
ncbi:MAG: DUF1704 domain-containing protein [Candidatus Omnitrophica bacterium]|nr:DUF1704 domain-containing protein [Candidatus Omnitrophota bacterium]